MKKAIPIMLSLMLLCFFAACDTHEPAVSSNTGGLSESSIPEVSSAQTSSEVETGSLSLPPDTIIDRTAYPGVLLTEELPFHQFFNSNNYRKYYAWMQGGTRSLVLPSNPDELGRDWDGIDKGVNGADVVISEMQQKYLIQNIQDIIAGYISGEYPLAPGEHPDYDLEFAPFSATWPSGVSMNIDIALSDVYYCTRNDYMYFNVGVFLLIDEDWLLCCEADPNTSVPSDAEDYWYIYPTYYFLNINGESL